MTRVVIMGAGVIGASLAYRMAKAGAVRNEPCVALDMTASTLAAAGIAIPEPFHGRPLFGPGARPRDFIVTARDRCDETMFRFRTVRDARYRYIKNFMPERPFLQANDYKERSYPVWNLIKEQHAAGEDEPFLQPFPGPRPQKHGAQEAQVPVRQDSRLPAEKEVKDHRRQSRRRRP